MIKEKKNKKINYELIFVLFLLIQPLLDVSYAIGYNIFNISIFLNTLVRFLFLGISFIYILIFSKNKIIKSFAFGIAMYIVLFIINIFYIKDVEILFYEVKNMFSTFFFPIVLLFCYDFFPKNKIEIANKYWVTLSCVYLFFIIIPNFLNMGFPSYAYGKNGFIGWFFSANAISSILLIILPLTILFFKEKDKIKFGIFYYLIIINTFFSIGTKAPILGLVIIVDLIFLWFVIKFFKNKQYKFLGIIFMSLIILAVVAIIVIPKTTFYKNIKIHMNYFEIYDVQDIFKNNVFINQIIFSERLDFNNRTKNNYKKSSLSEKLLGIGYVENYKETDENRKTIEIDYTDIYFRHGLAGFIIFFFPLIYCLCEIIRKIKKTTFENYMFFTSALLAAILACFCGHVLTSPTAGIVFIYIIATFFVRSDKNEKA